MPFPFVYVCDLLEDLSHLSNRVIPLLPKDLEYRTTETTLRWLKRHRNILDAASTDADCVILTLQPEKRSDRVYGLDAIALEQIIARVLNLPKQHCRDLQGWRPDKSADDLASCVERVMKNLAIAHNRVAMGSKAFAATAEQVDHALLRIASHNESSSADVRALALENNDSDAIDILGDLYQRLTPRDAKWLTRLILKNYGAVKFSDSLVCQANHSFLPRCVQVRAQFSSSIPSELRRDGPGSLRLTDVIKPTNNYLPTPPSTATPQSSAIPPSTATLPASAIPSHTALEPISLSAQNSIRGPATPSTGPAASDTVAQKSQILVAKDRNTLNKSRRTGNRASPTGAGRCRLTEQTCPLSNCFVILSPCISKTPWLIEKLLPWHGVGYATSLRALAGSCSLKRNSPTGKEYRQMALVESRKPKETAMFLKRIESLNLKGPQGVKLWIKVYDWRILEYIGKVDQGKEYTYDPWQRCWIGAV